MAGDQGTMVMLVTSRETGRWVLPKGWAKKRLSGSELAALEAFEEAGIEGLIGVTSIGVYRYAKRMPGGDAILCDVDVFPMDVRELLDDWPERGQRERRWFTPAEAASLVEEAGLIQLLLTMADTGGRDSAE